MNWGYKEKNVFLEINNKENALDIAAFGGFEGTWSNNIDDETIETENTTAQKKQTVKIYPYRTKKQWRQMRKIRNQNREDEMRKQWQGYGIVIREKNENKTIGFTEMRQRMKNKNRQAKFESNLPWNMEEAERRKINTTVTNE